MSFKRFGKVSFVSYTKVARFAEDLKYRRLMGTKCAKCGERYFPPRADCVKCLSPDMEWVEWGGKGNIVSFTTIHAAPTGFEGMAPYTIAVVELKDGGKALAWVEGAKEEDLKAGMEITLEPRMFEEIEEEKVYYAVVPARAASS